MSNQDDFSYAMQLVTIGSVPMVLLSAFRLGLFEIIDKAGPGAQLSPSQIVANLPSKNPDAYSMLDRMLHLLATHSVLTCSTGDTNSGIQRVYGLAPVAKYFVPNPDLGGASLGPVLALVQDKVYNDSWYALDDAVLKGGVPFDKIHGTNLFEYPDRDPRFNDVFNQAMIGHSSITIRSLLDTYKGFQFIKTLVDVGGGLGVIISRVTSTYPTIEGVQHIGGDMFESVPNGDAIFIKSVLHDWDDDHCLKLLKNCYDSLPNNGKLIVVESLDPINADTSSLAKVTCQMDMFMLAECPGGKERSEQEFLALASAAGFRGMKKECIVCCSWVMEFYK